MKVFSALVGGNGAHIVHAELQRMMRGYSLKTLPKFMGVVPHFQKFEIESADIVHGVPDAGAYIVPDGAGFVSTFHNYYLDTENLKYASLAQKLYYRSILAPAVKHAIKRSSVITAVSQFTASLVKEDLNVPGVEVILNGVDETRFFPIETHINPDRVFTVLFSGNPIKRKGADILSVVANNLPPSVKLRCTGGLRGYKYDASGVEYIGNVPYEAMPGVYQESDVLLLPSYREGLSLAVLEVMACGLPIIAYDSSSMSELVEDGKGGYLIEPGNISEVLEKIKKIFRNPRMRAEMGQYNREKILKNFRLRRMVSDYNELFGEVYRLS